MNECRRVEPLLAERATGDLAPPDAAQLDAHLAQCPRCRGELTAYQETFALARSPTAGSELPAGFAAAALAAWKRRGRRGMAVLAVGSTALAVAASAAIVFGPSLHAQRPPPHAVPELVASSDEADEAGQDGEDLTVEELALAAFDEAGQP